jgi:hypothetical protein
MPFTKVNVHQTCLIGNLDYDGGMSKICLLLMLAIALLVVGCGSTNPGSREFIPGKGWVPTPN